MLASLVPPFKPVVNLNPMSIIHHEVVYATKRHKVSTGTYKVCLAT